MMNKLPYPEDLIISLAVSIASRYVHNQGIAVQDRISRAFSLVGLPGALDRFTMLGVRVDASQQVLLCASKLSPEIIYAGLNGTVLNDIASIQRNLVITPDKHEPSLMMGEKVLRSIADLIESVFQYSRYPNSCLVISGHSQGAGIAGFLGQLAFPAYRIRGVYMLAGPRVWTTAYENQSVGLSKMTASGILRSYGHTDDIVPFLGSDNFNYPTNQWFFDNVNPGPLPFNPAWKGYVDSRKLVGKTTILQKEPFQNIISRMAAEENRPIIMERQDTKFNMADDSVHSLEGTYSGLLANYARRGLI